MSQLTLSVIVPNYNHGLLLPQALEDILAQSIQPKEILVIDDSSTDNSIEVIECFMQKYPNVQLIRNEKNRGVVFSANRGLELASGDCVYFAAADDFILPGLFEKSMGLLGCYPHAGLSSAIVESERDGQRIHLGMEDISLKDCFLSPVDCIGLLRRRGCWMGGNSTIYRRTALIEVGGLLPELGPLCDIFAEMVIALKYGVCFIPTLLSVQRLYASSYSAIEMANLNANIQMYSRAASLMLTTYKELFPPDFVSAWKEQEMHVARLHAYRHLQRQELVLFRSFFMHVNTIDQLAIIALNVAMKVQSVFLISYLWLRLGKDLRQVILRRLRIAILRIKRYLSSFISL